MSRYVQRLTPRHKRAGFSCGREECDTWFHQVAGQAEHRHGSARVFVLCDEDLDDGLTPLGFYALVGHAVRFEEAPEPVRKGQPRSPIGAVLLGQLAVDERYQRQGLGEMLLADVVRQCLNADTVVALPLLVVDALDDETAKWYEGYGFWRFSEQPLRLAIRLEDARVTFEIPRPNDVP